MRPVQSPQKRLLFVGRPDYRRGVSFAIGDKLTLTISDIAFGGEGVARKDDFVVFVPFVAVGEVVEAELTEVKKRFARGRLLEVLEPSAERVAPPCRYFGRCGGCQYQHLDYAAQLRLKHKQVCDLFERLGGLDPARVAPLIPCPRPYGYRNRIMIRSQWDKFKQGLNIGYIRADNRLVVDIEECLIAEPALGEQIRRVRAHPPPKGGLKVVLRIQPEGWEVPPDSFFQNNSFLLPKLVEVARAQLRQAGTRHLADVYCGVGFFSLELGDLVSRLRELNWTAWPSRPPAATPRPGAGPTASSLLPRQRRRCRVCWRGSRPKRPRSCSIRRAKAAALRRWRCSGGRIRPKSSISHATPQPWRET